MRTPAFTLIELLVVITIIVMLLALLTPALDNAIYQAELAVDGAQINGVLDAVSLYALDFKRFYPHRKGVRPTGDGAPVDHTPMDFARRASDDDRAVYAAYFDLNTMFNDPFVKPIDIEKAQSGSWIQGSYAMWFGYGYNKDGPHDGMFKMGDRFEWGGRHFDWLVTDHDLVGIGTTRGGHASHPDRNYMMINLVLQDNAGDDAERTAIGAAGFRYTFSRWEAPIPGSLAVNFVMGFPTPADRGLLDLNFGSADGAVIRTNHVPAVRNPTANDPVVHVPYHADDAAPEARLQLPR